MGFTALAVLVVLVIMIFSNAVRVLREYERGVIFRLGRMIGIKGPGLILLIPVLDRLVKISLRTVVMDVPPQDVITRDNVSVKVNAVLYFRVMDPARAVLEVDNFLYATSQLAQTTLRSVVGQAEMDDLLSERDKVNAQLQAIIDKQTDPWGIKVIAVEVKDVELQMEMKRAMAKQAEAERERRAKIINSEGEYQASERLAQAAAVIGRHPVAIQLRFLQTLREIATENNSTTIFPVPIDLIEPFRRMMDAKPRPVEGSGGSGAEGV